MNECHQGRMPGTIFFGKSHVIRQEVLQLFYVIEHHLTENAEPTKPSPDADSSLPRASVTGTCFP